MVGLKMLNKSDFLLRDINFYLIYIFCLLFMNACSVESQSNNSNNNENIGLQTDAQIWRPWELTNKIYTPRRVSTTRQPCPIESETIKYVDPIPTLVRLARENKVVMINESHYKPLHKAFIAKFAEALSKEGFGHYGAEPLSSGTTQNLNSPEGLAGRGYPIMSEASYLDEPIFGQVLEKIVDLDYQLFSYESSSAEKPEDIHPKIYRERQQAKNIIDYMELYPNEKFFIHAGFAHIVDSYDERSRTYWMAHHFKRGSAIDPFTISQTHCYGTNNYHKTGTLGYALIVDQSGDPVAMNGVDATIVPPVEPQERDRPVWLTEHMGRKLVDLPKAAIFNEYYTLITAKNIDRLPEAAPEDEIYRAPYSDKALALRSGNYELEIHAGKDVLLAKVPMTVGP